MSFKNQNEFTFQSFHELADQNYGVKGFEIRFQDMIEQYLDNNGIKAEWWQFLNRSVFFDLLEIYETSQKEDLLCSLQDYYYLITDEVRNRVAASNPVHQYTQSDDSYVS